MKIENKNMSVRKYTIFGIGLGWMKDTIMGTKHRNWFIIIGGYEFGILWRNMNDNLYDQMNEPFEINGNDIIKDMYSSKLKN